MGTLWRWGDNGNGQLGLGDTNRRSRPTRVGKDADWIMVTTGGVHTCALKGTARVRYCWGFNFAGRLGLGTDGLYDVRYERYLSPTSRGDKGWLTLSAGENSTCGIMKVVLGVSMKGLLCWGNNFYGQAGTGSRDHVLTPTVVNGLQWTEVNVGHAFACGLRNGSERYCWGNSGAGRLGLGQLAPSDSPVTVPTSIGDGSWSTVSAGSTHACGISVNRRAYCWGWRGSGVLGLGEPGPNDGCCLFAPETRLPGTSWARIYTGASSTCGLTTNGTRLCWGNNSRGQLGLGDHETRYSPAEAEEGPVWESLALGLLHACGIQKTGDLFCWGYNDFGQLGSPQVSVGETRTLPVPVG